MAETTKSEVAPGEKVMCIYPGCDQEAVTAHKKDNSPKRQGPPPRYCANEQHNAATAFAEMKRLEEEAAK
jgi:hypothetical protein